MWHVQDERERERETNFYKQETQATRAVHNFNQCNFRSISYYQLYHNLTRGNDTTPQPGDNSRQAGQNI